MPTSGIDRFTPVTGKSLKMVIFVCKDHWGEVGVADRLIQITEPADAQ